MGLPCGVFNSRPEEDMAIVRTKTQWFLIALGIAFAATLAIYLPMDWLVWLIMLGIYVVAVLGLHIVTGLCGQFSMGHSAFMLVGAYTTALLGQKYGVPAWGTLPLAGLFAGVVGLVFATPAVRIKGFYLVMATIAAQFIIQWVVREGDWAGGVYGTPVPDLVFFGKIVDYRGFWWLTLVVVLASIYFVKNLQRTATGRRLVAVRDNDLAAEVMGVNLFQTKLLAFFVGSFFAGIAGWLWAYFMGHITPLQFDFKLSLMFLGMVIVGGMGSTTGAIFGTVILRLTEKLVDYISAALSDAFPGIAVQIFPAMSLIVFAAVVMFFIMVEPRGAYHRFTRFKIFYRLHPFSF
ncbi:MAG: hypothetical protein A2Y91_05140 [Chloroflexi bacterium RBG_13_54_8]|nr:MAG: hypothetical protein A2Y91_05140 [Chloroflexi bacterium RBG_13_54_8]